jgi:Carboxypeptidase regulatory-like domain
MPATETTPGSRGDHVLPRCLVRGILILVSMLVAHRGPAQELASAPAQGPTEGKVTGLVVDSMFEPIVAAYVEIRTWERRVLAQTRTDAAGKFTVAGLPLRGLFVCATEDGVDRGFTYATPSADAAAPERVLVRCFDAAAISGVVKDLAGKPIAGAQVIGAFDASKQHNSTWFEFDTAVTDASGKYILRKVPLGDVNVRVSAKGFEFGESSLYLTQDTTADLALTPGAGRQLEVRVEGVPGDRLSSIRCSMTLTRDGVLAMPRRLIEGSLDERGVWLVQGLPKDVGLWRIQVQGPGIRFHPETQDVDVDGERDGDRQPDAQVVFKVEAITTLPGAPPRRKGTGFGGAGKTSPPESDAKNAAAANKAASPPEGKPGRNTRAFRGILKTKKGKPLAATQVHLHTSSTGWRHAITAADGSFTVWAQYSDEERISVNLHNPEWVLVPDKPRRRSLRLFQRGVWHEFDAKKTYRILVMPASTVRGIVLDHRGKPASGLWVRLEFEVPNLGFGLGKFRSFMSGARTDQAGEFSMDGLGKLEGKLWVSVADARGFAELGPLKVKGKRAVKGLKLRLVKPAVVEGWVVGPRGKPVVGARVEIVAWDVGRKKAKADLSEETITNRRGRFRHRGLKPGEYALRIRIRGAKPVTKPTTFKLGRGRTLKKRIKVRKL